MPTHQQGVKILGTPLGHVDFAHTELELVAMDHQVLLDRIPCVPDVQAAWLLLLHCAQARANYMLRMIPPEAVQSCSSVWATLTLWRRGAGDGPTPFDLGRIGLAQCRRSACPSVLGDLGRLPSDDS